MHGFYKATEFVFVYVIGSFSKLIGVLEYESVLLKSDKEVLWFGFICFDFANEFLKNAYLKISGLIKKRWLIAYVQVPTDPDADCIVRVLVPAAPIVNVTVWPAAPPTVPDTSSRPVVLAATSAV